MTVSTTSAAVSYAGDGASTTFAVPFQFYAVTVYAVTVTSATLLTLAVHYSITGGNGSTGSVVAVTAPAVGTSWRISRATPQTQTTAISDAGPFPAAAFELAYDKLTMIDQEAQERANRAMSAPPYETASMVLPQASLRANKIPVFDSSGNLTVADIPGAGTSLTGDASLATVTGTGSETARTLAERFGEAPSLPDFRLAIDADDSNAFIRAAASGAKRVLVPAGMGSGPGGAYSLSLGFVVPDGVVFEGQGGAHELGFDLVHPTTLLLTGTGAKSHTVAGCGSHTVANPDVGAAYLADSGTRGDTYALLDLTVAFSAAIILGRGSGLRNMAVVPNFDGVDGYAGSDGRLSDEWDVGIWCRNSEHFTLDGVQCVGHWRKAAVLQTASDIGEGVTPSNQLGRASHCYFQGFRGLAIRSRDPIVETNWGFASTVYSDCFFRGLAHQSGHLATSSFLDTPFDSPSGPIEIAGGTMRGVKFRQCTLHTHDDFLVFCHNDGETYFHGCYFEAKSCKVSGATLANSAGSRMIATSGTARLQFSDQSKFGADFSPYYVRESNVGRYTSGVDGVFTPATARDSEYTFPMFSTSMGMRLRPGQVWRVYADDASPLATINADGQLNVPSIAAVVADHENLRTTTEELNLVRADGAGTAYVLRAYSSGNVQVWGPLRPEADNTRELGSSSTRWSQLYATTARFGDGTTSETAGAGSPEGVITASGGSRYWRSDGGAGTRLYFKTSGSGNTGWTAIL